MFRNLFILLVFQPCFLFSADGGYVVISGGDSDIRGTLKVGSTAAEFASFVENARRARFESKVCERIAKKLIDCCETDGQYVETHPDLVNKSSYFKVLCDDYKPLLDALLKLDRKQHDPNVFFDCVLDVYIRNLRDRAGHAKMSLEDDGQFGIPQKSDKLYQAGGLDFFRDPNFLPNYQRFLNNVVKGLTQDHTRILTA